MRSDLICNGACASWGVDVAPAGLARNGAPSSAWRRSRRGWRSREAFAAEMAAELGPGVRVLAAASAEEAVSGAHVISCATTSFEP